MDLQIHNIQMRILKHLLMNKRASFSELSKESGVESDHFNYHLSSLLKSGLLVKVGEGYQLTIPGKEFANRMDTDRNIIEKQGKIDVMVIVRKQLRGKTCILVQKRLKEPFYGFQGYITGKVGWGEDFLTAAQRELQEETGLSADLEYRYTLHEHIFLKSDDRLLEDKCFFVFAGSNPQGKLTSFQGGENRWVEEQEFMELTDVFYDEKEILSMLKSGQGGLIEKDYRVETF